MERLHGPAGTGQRKSGRYSRGDLTSPQQWTSRTRERAIRGLARAGLSIDSLHVLTGIETAILAAILSGPVTWRLYRGSA